MFCLADNGLIAANLALRRLEGRGFIGLPTSVALIPACMLSTAFGAHPFHISIRQKSFIIFAIELQSRL